MAKPNIHVEKSKEGPESVALLAKSIVEVAKASKKLTNSGLTKDAIITLLHRQIGGQNISRFQIELVLENLPRLTKWYKEPTDG